MTDLKLAISRNMVETHPRHANEYEPILVLGYYRGMIYEYSRRILGAQRAMSRSITTEESDQLSRMTEEQVRQCERDLENVGVDHKVAISLSKMIGGDQMDMMQAVEDCRMYCTADSRFARRSFEESPPF